MKRLALAALPLLGACVARPAPPPDPAALVLAAGIAAHRLRLAILVAVWNSDNRLGEYMAEAALAGAPRAASEPGRDLFRGLRHSSARASRAMPISASWSRK